MYELTLPSGGNAKINVRRSARARNLLLHVGTIGGDVELVLPRGATLSEGLSFAREKALWIETRLKKVRRPIPFRDGLSIPLLGEPVTLRFLPGERGAVWREGSEVFAPGHREHIPRRVRDWFMDQASQEIRVRASDKAERIGSRHGRITIRDQRTRWGSCTHQGNMNFSWRLILAPEPVLDYVVAHEVAHLKEMNHSRRFWNWVDRLCPDADDHRHWLVENGPELHRYG